MALKASSTPTELPAEVTALCTLALMAELLRASTLTPAVVRSVLVFTQASALPSTLLVAMVPLAATTVPPPLKELPPDDVLLLSALVSMVEREVASTEIDPACTTASSTLACTALRTSLKTTMPPTATEALSEILKPAGIRLVASTSFQKSRLL